MQTFSNIKGLPVFLQDSVKKIGMVEDLCIRTNGDIYGILINMKGFLVPNKIVSLKKNCTVGEDGVFISSLNDLESKELPEDVFLLSKKHGKPLLSHDGEQLGLVLDVYFKEEVGTIIGCEVSDGFFADLTEGRKVIKTNKQMTIGEDGIVIDL